MKNGRQCEGEDQSPIAGDVEAPAERHNRQAKHDDRDDGEERDEEGDAEALEDTRDLNEEVRALDLLLGGTPLDVVANEIGDECLREMDRKTAEEEEAVEKRSAMDKEE
jgi:hypothetical protein